MEHALFSLTLHTFHGPVVIVFRFCDVLHSTVDYIVV
jgi:hypothetical protein